MAELGSQSELVLPFRSCVMERQVQVAEYDKSNTHTGHIGFTGKVMLSGIDAMVASKTLQ